MDKESELIEFYRGRTSDQSGRYIENIWVFSLEELEYHHDFIQWLFPLPEISRVNTRAPLLSQKDMQLFRKDRDLQSRVYRSFKLMADFYGFELEEHENKSRLVRSPDFEKRTRNWITPGNHNFLRITRILKFLTMVGQTEISQAFFEVLKEIYRSKGMIIGNSFQFWKEAMEDKS